MNKKDKIKKIYEIKNNKMIKLKLDEIKNKRNKKKE